MTPVQFDDFDGVTLQLTEMASQQIVPVRLLHPDARVDLDVMANMAIITFRGQLVTSDKATQRSTFEYVERWKPWWLPKFLWSRIPSRKNTEILETRYAATHPFADIPGLDERLGPIALKTLKQRWVEHSE